MGRIIVYILVIVLAISCGLNKRPVDERQYFLFQENFNDKDTLYIKDFILYNTSKGRDYRLNIRMHEDSIFTIIKSALNKLNLNIEQVEQGHNYAALSFFSEEHLTYDHINKSLLFKSASTLPGKYVLFPVLLIYHERLVNLDATRPGFPKFSCSLSLAIFIVKDDEVVYYKQSRYNKTVKKDDHPYDYEEFIIPVPEERWDGLVREVMKEYIERLK
jgi:hypothetical protein